MSALVTSVSHRVQLPCTRWCCPTFATLRPRSCQLTTLTPYTRNVVRYPHSSYTSSAPATSRALLHQSLSVPQLLSHLSALSSPSNPIRGTAFEHVSLALLTSLPLPLHLTHTGQSNDQGVDLLGVLSSPSAASSDTLHRVVCQCKMEGKPTGAASLRGLEGTVGQYASGGGSVIGMLVSAQPYTQQAEAQWRRSVLPLLLVSIDTQAAHAIAEIEDAEQMQASEMRETLLRCLRRFSLNPAATAALPHIKAVKQTLNTAQPYIAVKQLQ